MQRTMMEKNCAAKRMDRTVREGVKLGKKNLTASLAGKKPAMSRLEKRRMRRLIF